MRIYIKVVPKSSRNKVEKISEGDYKVWVTAPPVDGKANEAVIKLLAKHFSVSKSLVEIVGGKSAKTKIIDIMML
jgi:hypothetical protein